jgi:hypothetical protein
MDESTVELDQLVTELPKVLPDTIDMVTYHLRPEDDYYSEKIEYMKMTNNYLSRYLNAYSNTTTYPEETVRTALLAYSLLEEEAGKAPIVTRKAARAVENESLDLEAASFAWPILDRIRRNNIFYYNALQDYIHQTKDPGGNWYTAALFHRLFEKQAELNKLKIN